MATKSKANFETHSGPRVGPRSGKTLDTAAPDAESLAGIAQDTKIELERIRDHWKRVDAAELLVTAGKMKAEEVAKYRDNLILSLVLHEGYSALSVAQAAGVSRAWVGKVLDSRAGGKKRKLHLSRLTEAQRVKVATENSVRKYRDAAATLAEVYRQITEHYAVADAAREVRDDAIRALLATEEGLTQAAVAERMRWNPSNVAHIMRAGRQAASVA